MRSRSPALAFLWVLFAIGLGLGLVFILRIKTSVDTAVARGAPSLEAVRPLSFSPAAAPRVTIPMWGDSSILSVARVGDELWTGGGAGLSDGRRTVTPNDGLSTLRASAVASWGTSVVFSLEAGGWGRISGTGVEEASSGWGRLDVRAFTTTPAGDLLVAARQGLFLAPPGGESLERISSSPVRALALLPGGSVAAGGERGLVLVSLSGGAKREVTVPDSWVSSLGWDGRRLWAATPAGIYLGDPSAEAPALLPHPRGSDARGGAIVEGEWWALSADGRQFAILGWDGSRREEPNRQGVQRLFASSGILLGDAPAGLTRRETGGQWALVRPHRPGSLARPHVNALAARGTDLFLGFFDAGIAVVSPDAARQQLVAGPFRSPEAWGVNALSFGSDVLWAATLRGVFRIRVPKIEPLEGPGGAYSLATTPSGMAIGYGQGVVLPGRKMLSAFHGLPGNQAVALASNSSSGSLWVGTPTGLGRIDEARVTARVIPGQGKLPHPWVTALLDEGDLLLVGTWGGGVAARSGEGAREVWSPFPETAALRINAGAILKSPDGRVWIGTQGSGLWRSDPERTRFEPVRLPLPSKDVFSLVLFPPGRPDSLFVGTNEGLARVPLPLPGSVPEV